MYLYPLRLLILINKPRPPLTKKTSIADVWNESGGDVWQYVINLSTFKLHLFSRKTLICQEETTLKYGSGLT